jgi:hypothetical protein
VFNPPTALEELNLLFLWLHSRPWTSALHKEPTPVGARRLTHRSRDLQGALFVLCVCFAVAQPLHTRNRLVTFSCVRACLTYHCILCVYVLCV